MAGSAGSAAGGQQARRTPRRRSGATASAPLPLLPPLRCQPCTHPCAACQKVGSSLQCPPPAAAAPPLCARRSAQSRSACVWGRGREGGGQGAGLLGATRPATALHGTPCSRTCQLRPAASTLGTTTSGSTTATATSRRQAHRQRVCKLLHIGLRRRQRILINVHPHHVLCPQDRRPDGQHRLHRGAAIGTAVWACTCRGCMHQGHQAAAPCSRSPNAGSPPHRAAAQVDDRLAGKLVKRVGHLQPAWWHSYSCACPAGRRSSTRRRCPTPPHREEQAGGEVGPRGVLLQLHLGLLKGRNVLAGRTGRVWGVGEEERQLAAAAGGGGGRRQGFSIAASAALHAAPAPA